MLRAEACNGRTTHVSPTELLHRLRLLVVFVVVVVGHVVVGVVVVLVFGAVDCRLCCWFLFVCLFVVCGQMTCFNNSCC